MKMANEKKSIIEEALLEAEQIDATFKSNAKEILAQTMSSEIEEMVKESLTGSRKRLKEENEEEEETELELETEEEEEDNENLTDVEETEEEEIENEEDLNFNIGDDETMTFGDEITGDDEEVVDDLDLGTFDDESEELELGGDEEIETVDLTDVTDDAKVISVFKKMGPEDEIEVVNDNGIVTLKDNKSGSEYRIEMNSEGEVASVEAGDLELEESNEDSDEVIYEIVVDDEEMLEEEYSDEDYMMNSDEDYMYDEDYMMNSDEEDYMSMKMDYADDSYNSDDEDYMSMKMDYMEAKKKCKPDYIDLNHNGDTEECMKDAYKEVKARKNGGKKESDEMDYMARNQTLAARQGWKHDSPTRRAYKNMDGIYTESTTPQITKLIKENTNLNTKLTSIESENSELKDTQEKMVEALKQFRKKLQEVAVFNSNLTYAVRLFTENSTTKEEKQEILKRLDSAKDLKESQLIYKQLVKEFSTSKAPIKESIDEKINKIASSGAQISESSVFVHPELQNMKKLWEYKYKK